jgi:hypothetical protein
MVGKQRWSMRARVAGRRTLYSGGAHFAGIVKCEETRQQKITFRTLGMRLLRIPNGLALENPEEFVRIRGSRSRR